MTASRMPTPTYAKGSTMKYASARLLLFFLLVSSPALSTNAQRVVERWVHPNILLDARQLLGHIGPENTDYRHKDNLVSWGENGTTWQCYADCSGFINALLVHTYKFTEDMFEKNFGHRRMYAYHYFDAIQNGKHFYRIRNIRDIRPGDIIALQYADRSEHDDNTGHVMVVDSLPEVHRPSKVFAPNTRQFLVPVIDCSRSAHGSTDTRYEKSYSGLGRGAFRLYTDPNGEIVGYSWSGGNPKEGFDPFENAIVVGRTLF
mgnify:CR=1 FL=1